jgi:hypothetical protein
MSSAILSVTSLPATRVASGGTALLPKEHGSWSLAFEPGALVGPTGGAGGSRARPAVSAQRHGGLPFLA